MQLWQVRACWGFKSCIQRNLRSKQHNDSVPMLPSSRHNSVDCFKTKVSVLLGNAELVKLLITRMADAGSKNKSGKSALDLARDPAIKEILTEAILAAAQPQEDPLRPDTSGAEQPSLPDSMQKSVDSTTAANAEIGPPERPLQEPSEGVTGANVEIGPPERPNTSVHTSNMPFSDNSQQTADEPHTHKRTKPDVGHDLNSKSEDHRPGKVQKVALSFVEDDDDEG